MKKISILTFCLLGSLILLNYSCKKQAIDNQSPNKVDLTQTSKNNSQIISSPEFLSKTQLSAYDVNLIESNFGIIDLTTFKENSPSLNKFIYSVSIKTLDKSIIKNLVVTDVINLNVHHYNCIITTLESFDKTIDVSLNYSKIQNGKISINFLNNGAIFERTLKNGSEIKSESLTGLKFDDKNTTTSSFAWDCVPNCAGAKIRDMNWVEAAACVLNPAECLAVITIYCTSVCIGS